MNGKKGMLTAPPKFNILPQKLPKLPNRKPDRLNQALFFRGELEKKFGGGIFGRCHQLVVG